MSKTHSLTSRLMLAARCAAVLAPVAVLAGCAAKGKMAIPEGAEAVKTDTGSVTWDAKHAGDVWVYDADTNKMIYTGPVRDGDTVRVNAAGDTITVGGKTVSERKISDEHKYRIYYRRS
jgi:hypothetical protein